MTTPENDELLTGLEGTHRLLTIERIAAACWPAFWINLAVGSIATAVLAMLVARVTPATLDDMTTLPVKLVLGVAVLVVISLLAGWSGVVRYVIDADSVRAEAGPLGRSWRIPSACGPGSVLGHRSLSTTAVYTHLAKTWLAEVTSPLDNLKPPTT